MDWVVLSTAGQPPKSMPPFLATHPNWLNYAASHGMSSNICILGHDWRRLELRLGLTVIFPPAFWLPTWARTLIFSKPPTRPWTHCPNLVTLPLPCCTRANWNAICTVIIFTLYPRTWFAIWEYCKIKMVCVKKRYSAITNGWLCRLSNL